MSMRRLIGRLEEVRYVGSDDGASLRTAEGKFLKSESVKYKKMFVRKFTKIGDGVYHVDGSISVEVTKWDQVVGTEDQDIEYVFLDEEANLDVPQKDREPDGVYFVWSENGTNDFKEVSRLMLNALRGRLNKNGIKFFENGQL